MPNRRALCSTGCFSRESNLWSLDVITRGLREVTGTGFEVIVYRGWYDTMPAFADSIVATGADTPVVHAEKSIGPSLAADDEDEARGAVDRFGINCAFAREIGARRLVLHLWGLPHSDTRLDRQLAALPRLVDLAADHGLTLSIESLLCQVGTPVDAVARSREADPRSGITLDTAFLAMHGQLGTAVSDDRLWPGVDHVHIKDYADIAQGWGTAHYLHPGEGSLDLSGFVDGLQTRGYPGSLTLESFALLEDDSPDVDRIQTSLAWMRSALGVDG